METRTRTGMILGFAGLLLFLTGCAAPQPYSPPLAVPAPPPTEPSGGIAPQPYSPPVAPTPAPTAIANAAGPSAFEKLQSFLASKSFAATDAGNKVTEKITVERNGTEIVFHQVLGSVGDDGSVYVEIDWALSISLLLSAKIEKHEFADKTLKISLVSESGADVLPFSSVTRMKTRDGRSGTERNSGKSDKLGISFTTQKEASEFLLLYESFVAELKKG